MRKTRIVKREEVIKLLSMKECIACMEDTLKDISAGRTIMLQRSMIPNPESGTAFAIMPSSMPHSKRAGAKVIMFSKKPTAQGIIPLFDTQSGALLAIIDAKHITGLRTAATSAAATNYLANKDASTLGILGAGRLGRMHIEAICLVRDIKKIYIWDRTPENAAALAKQTFEQYGIEAIACESAEQATVRSDIVCTVTSAKEYFLEGKWLKPGAHVNAVGACSAGAREVDAEAVRRSLLFSDQTEAVLKDGGDVILAIKEGTVTKDHILAEVGKVMLGQCEGRRTPEDITMFESVGISVEDVACANLIYQKALQLEIGVDVEF